MANLALDCSDQNTDLYQEYYEALKNVRDIIEQQNVKLKQQTLKVGKKNTKPNSDARKKLLREKKKLEAILKLLKDGESKDQIANGGDEIDEINEARELLIDGLSEMENSNHIGVKRMGNLESMPFYNAVKRRYKKEDALRIALDKCALWNDRIRDPRWRPFKVVIVEGESLEIVDDNDKKLKMLKMEMGEKVYKAVTKALTEMNEYNSNDRNLVSELWNFNENRKATLKEGIASVLTHMDQRKRTRLLP